MKDSDTDGFFKRLINKAKSNIPRSVAIAVGICALIALVVYIGAYFKQAADISKNVEELKKLKEQIMNEGDGHEPKLVTPTPIITPTSKAETSTLTPTGAEPDAALLTPTGVAVIITPGPSATAVLPSPTPEPPEMTETGKAFCEINPDYRGWLSIEGTDIDYPVVAEKTDDDSYYLKHWFDGSENRNGTLFIPPECQTGVGTLVDGFAGGIRPTTNILIFGHNQKSGKMFGKLDSYLSQDFYEEHKYISFETAYEQRTYEVIAVFKSHVFMQDEDAFRYYFFYNAKDQVEFDYWYENIKERSEIKTDATAVFGDTFLTLSTCSDTDETGKHNENGRLAVIAVRIK